MGQYFKGIILDNNEHNVIDEFANSYDYGNGAKLMEHSWLTNNFVGVIENRLLNNPRRIIWCGDYADKDPNLGLDEEGDPMNLYNVCDLEENESKRMIGGDSRISKRAKYIVNHSTSQFIDKTKVPVTSVYTNDKGKSWDYIIHPLPLMTCNSNGRGGGDYSGEDKNNLVGSWSGDLISIETKKPKDFIEIIFDLKE